MTIQELYDWAVKKNITEAQIQIDYAEAAPNYNLDLLDIFNYYNKIVIVLP